MIADFIGETNFIPGKIASVNGETTIVDTAIGTFEGVVSDPAWKPETGDSATLSIRPESWTITAEPPGANSAQGRIGESIYLGEIAQYQFLAGSLALKIFEMNPQPSERPSDRELFACAAPRDVVVLRS